MLPPVNDWSFRFGTPDIEPPAAVTWKSGEFTLVWEVMAPIVSPTALGMGLENCRLDRGFLWDLCARIHRWIQNSPLALLLENQLDLQSSSWCTTGL